MKNMKQKQNLILNSILAFWLGIVGGATHYIRKYFLDSDSYGGTEISNMEDLYADGNYTVSVSTIFNYVKELNVTCPLKGAGTNKFLFITLIDNNEGKINE